MHRTLWGAILRSRAPTPQWKRDNMSRIPLWLRVAALVAALIAMLAMITFAPTKGQARQNAVLITDIKDAIGVAATMHVCGAIEDAGNPVTTAGY